MTLAFCKGKKKGQVFLAFILFVVLFAIFAIFAIIGNAVNQDINDIIQADSSIPAVSKNISQQNADAYSEIFDGAYLFFFVLLWMFALVAAYFTETKPIMFVVALILLIFFLVATVFLGNMLQEVSDDDALSSSANDMPMMKLINENFFWVILVMVISITIALFARDQ